MMDIHVMECEMHDQWYAHRYVCHSHGCNMLVWWSYGHTYIFISHIWITTCICILTSYHTYMFPDYIVKNTNANQDQSLQHMFDNCNMIILWLERWDFLRIYHEIHSLFHWWRDSTYHVTWHDMTWYHDNDTNESHAKQTYKLSHNIT